MRKQRETTTIRRPAHSQPVFSDDPARDDPHDAIDQELLGIWLSISRLRQLIRRDPPPPGCTVLRLPRRSTRKPAKKNAATKKQTTTRKPRRKAA